MAADRSENRGAEPIENEQDHSRHSRITKRRPSAAVAVILMTQLQFLAMLSLVDSTVDSDSWTSDFLIGLRCVVDTRTCASPGAKGS